MPDEAAVLVETGEQLSRDLDAGERPILEMRLLGYTTPEITERVEYALTTPLLRS